MKKSSGFNRSRGTASGSATALQFFFVVPKEQNSGSIYTEYLAENRSGEAIRCFLSPVDALIDASLSNLGAGYDLVAASGTSGSFNIEREGLVAAVHHAWVARDQTPMLRASGRLIPHVYPIPSQPGTGMLRFRLEPRTYQTLDRTYEQAGLFAWRETLAEVCRWSRARVDDTVRYALQTICLADFMASRAAPNSCCSTLSSDSGISCRVTQSITDRRL